MNSIEQIKSILNPVRVLKVSDWLKISAMCPKDHTMKNSQPLMLISRYESLTSQPLVKEHFVCEIEEPKAITSNLYKWADAIGTPREEAKVNHQAEYQAAQKKLLFEGFKSLQPVAIGYDVHTDDVGLNFYKYNNDNSVTQLYLTERQFYIQIVTVADFIYQMDFYNRTASNPIQINFSDNFINELIK